MLSMLLKCHSPKLKSRVLMQDHSYAVMNIKIPSCKVHYRDTINIRFKKNLHLSMRMSKQVDKEKAQASTDRASMTRGKSIPVGEAS